MGKPEEKLFQIFSEHVPENAQHYCIDLWYETRFNFKVTRRRNSKLGDYKYDRIRNGHTISVNHNLNKFLFLITYIHEVAHLRVTQKYGLRIAPHGKEWKSMFRELMMPMLSDLIFPDDILRPLARHMKNPKASSQSDLKLVVALRNYDPETDLVHLEQIDEGDHFFFQGHQYTKLKLRRTRVLCLQCKTGRKYLIPKIALVHGMTD